MSDTGDRGASARQVFSGMVPSSNARHRSEHDVPFRSTRLGRGVMATVPVVLAGAMTVSMNLTGPLEAASAATKQRPTKAKSELGKSLREVITSAVKTTSVGSISTAAAAPASYIVAAGDTVSSIAGRFGLSTASVLAANGLSWKSLIFPGQVLKLAAASTNPVAANPAPANSAPPNSAPPAPAAVTGASRYTIQKGDTISRIAARFGVTTHSVLTANGLGWSSIIYGGQTITIPAGGSSSPAIQTVSSVTPVTPAPAAPAASTSYTIRSGDTISSIARSTGVAVSALLSANSMTASSIIYAGRTLLIPGASAPTAASTAVATSDELAANARTIIQVGRRLGVPDRGIVVALSAAAQESGLRNLNYGDRDSLGIFQQRPSTGWGTSSQLLNVDYAARLFYGGPSNPNTGRTRGLLDIAGWQGMTVTQAAQAVQISAYPDAYAKWETSAWSWLKLYG